MHAASSARILNYRRTTWFSGFIPLRDHELSWNEYIITQATWIDWRVCMDSWVAERKCAIWWYNWRTMWCTIAHTMLILQEELQDSTRRV